MDDSANDRPVTRRRFLFGATAAIGAGGALALGYGLGPGRNLLDVTRHVVRIPGLPAELEGFRIAHVTDAHLGAFRDVHRDVLAALDALQPDLVACTGDLINGRRHTDDFIRFYDAVGERSDWLFTTFGNWERGSTGVRWAEDVRQLFNRHSGVLLEDEHLQLDNGLVVAGADDPVTGHFERNETFAGLPEAPARIFLAHSPIAFDATSPPSPPTFDLCLAGHTHGGQIRLGPVAPVTPPGSGPYVYGFYDTPTGPAYVSRGIGTTGPPVRIMCRPELPVFDLVRAEPPA
ncbi:MAG: metallophosphoesterase [Bradymonadaceae bacterium]